MTTLANIQDLSENIQNLESILAPNSFHSDNMDVDADMHDRWTAIGNISKIADSIGATGIVKALDELSDHMFYGATFYIRFALKNLKFEFSQYACDLVLTNPEIFA